EFPEPLREGDDPYPCRRCVTRTEEADNWYLPRLLRPRRERPRRCRAAEQRDCLAARLHSITSSARASSIAGMSRRRARAVGRLMTSSNLLDRTTGRSAGLVPLRMRAV